MVFTEEISKVFSGGFVAAFAVQQFMSSPYLMKHGSDFIKEKYLTKAISGDAICSIAISEPNTGSDVANIRTTAVEKNHYIVNGSKTFITSGVYGDVLVTVLKLNPEEGFNGISLLVIDRNAEGVSATKLKKLGWHASDTAELSFFDNVKVPVENLLGEENHGFFYFVDGLQLERLVGAIGGYAGSEAALIIHYNMSEKAFGRPINKFQVLRHRVAQMSSEIESIKYFIITAAGFMQMEM